MRICASTILALLRSSELKSAKHLASNNRFSCRAAGIAGGILIVFTALLLNDCCIVRGALVPADVNQQLVQLGERRQIHTRRTCGHPCADHWVEHPGSNGDNNAGRSLHLQVLASRPLLDTANANLAAKIRVASVMDFQLLSDMGTMDGR